MSASITDAMNKIDAINLRIKPLEDRRAAVDFRIFAGARDPHILETSNRLQSEICGLLDRKQAIIDRLRSA